MSFGQVDLAKPLRVGRFTYRNRVLLAPLSGISDVPFRQLAWEAGAGMVTSEMVASEALVTGQADMRIKAEGAGLPLHVVQLAGREPCWMKRAVEVASDAGADVIDINMGCPAKKVCTGLSGSALMRDLERAERLIETVLEAFDGPVTLKMRLGWDDQSINAPELARRAERAGIAMVTVHARTRNQFYKGTADWSRVRPVREEIGIPLVINGDIATRASAKLAMQQSGADAVMIGRASCGQPWLSGEMAGLGRRPGDLASYVVEHHRRAVEAYGTLGARSFRKHIQWYGERAGLSAAMLRPLLTSADPSRTEDLIHLAFADDKLPVAA